MEWFSKAFTFRVSFRENAGIHASSAAHTVRIAVVFILCYLLLAWISRIYFVRPFAITPWNPTAGLALAFLLIFGLRMWPALAIAAASVYLLTRGLPAAKFPQLLGPAIVTIGHVGMAWTLKNLAGFKLQFDRTHDTIALVATAAIGTLLIAFVFVSILNLDNPMDEVVFRRTILRSWIGHFIGVAVVTPLLLLCLNNRSALFSTIRRWPPGELVSQVLAIAFVLWVVFHSGLMAPTSLFYVIFLPLIWVAVRRGINGAILFNGFVQVGLIAAIVIADYQSGMAVTEIQFLMLGLAVTALVLGTTVSERKVALEDRELSESRLRAIVATAPDCIMTVDRQGFIVAANPAAERIFGVLPHELVGLPITKVLPDFGCVARFGEVEETSGVRSDGSPFAAELAVSDMKSPPLSIVITRDVSRRKEFERQLSEQQAQLNRTARLAAAGETAAALAHELHQPLAAIRNYIHALQMIIKVPEQGLLGKVEHEAVRAADVVRRLRDFFRSGISRLERTRVQDLIDDVARVMREQASHQSVTVRVESDDPNMELLIDRVQVAAVMHNLVGNAIDAIAAEGGDNRRVDVIAKEADSGWVRISVIDTGPGISNAMQGRLFEPFATTKVNGTGLGLAVSRSMVEAHGGKLWAQADALGHTAFHFTLPKYDAKDENESRAM